MTDELVTGNTPQYIRHMYDEWLHLLVSGYLHPGETFARFMMSMSNARGQTTRRSRHRRIPVLMGGAAVFSPSDIAGLQLWLDASDLSTLFTDAAGTILAGDGDVVGRWSDKSALAQHFIQATTARKPTLQFNIQNSLPIVRGDGTDDILDKVLAAITNETIFIVAKNDAPAAEGVVLGGGAQFRFRYATTAGRIEYKYNAVNNIVSSGFTETNFNLFRCVYDGTVTKLSVNNAVPPEDAVVAASHQYATLFAESSGSRELLGDIGEIFVYDNEVSDADVVLLDTYAKEKWNTP